MRRIVFTASILFLLPLTALGQDTPSVEVFGGFSYFHTEGGGNLYGWNASVNANLTKWFGLVVDTSGHYDSSSSRSTVIITPGSPPSSFRFDSKQNFHTFMVGPRFSLRKHEKITPFTHLLFGLTRRHFESKTEGPGFPLFSFSNNQTGFAAAIGTGVDVKISKRFVLRVIQADYLLTRSFGEFQNNARLSTGLVYRFGAK